MQELGKEAIDAIKSLAEKIGTTSEQIFEVLVKQAKIDVLIYFIQSIILSFACFYYIKFVLNSTNSNWFAQGR